MGHRIFDVTGCLQGGAKRKLHFKGAPKRRAQDILEPTRIMDRWENMEHKKRARTQLKAIIRRDMCGCYNWLFSFLFLDGIHAISLDMWMIRYIIQPH